jgi:hypothetical protein
MKVITSPTRMRKPAMSDTRKSADTGFSAEKRGRDVKAVS